MPVPTVMGEPIEDEKKAIREWRESDNKVVAWLLATMEPHISKIMTYQKTTKQIWDKAKRLYSKRKKSLSCLSASTRTSSNQVTTQSICL
jgi:hypothetical protein